MYSYTHWLRPSPPHLGSYTRALLVSQDRRHLFVTPCNDRSVDFPQCSDDIDRTSSSPSSLRLRWSDPISHWLCVRYVGWYNSLNLELTDFNGPMRWLPGRKVLIKSLTGRAEVVTFQLSALYSCAGILKQSMGDRNRVRIGSSYRQARLQSLAELVPWKRFLGSLKV